ncbi:MAG: YggS family pyridoxal phosphate-dependent enzyme, partial [Planctomycetes bacterium]|nr:YggS family pyridoxal phosphate-dependent enzyme [Planctomycetota bacterium]
NLAGVRARMAAACARAGRATESVRLVAVTKTVSPDAARALFELGVPDLGENRVQQAEEKVAALSGLGIRWHMIGHLQRNKVKKAVEIFEMIHSVDSFRLAEEINKQCERRNRPMPVLIEVNVSGEATKSGVAPGQLRELVTRAAQLPFVRVQGLMTMAPIAQNPEDVRPVFRRLRELRDELASVPNAELKELSMGMTQDFEVAIEEGATMIRVGTALFQGL